MVDRKSHKESKMRYPEVIGIRLSRYLRNYLGRKKDLISPKMWIK